MGSVRPYNHLVMLACMITCCSRLHGGDGARCRFLRLGWDAKDHRSAQEQRLGRPPSSQAGKTASRLT